MLINVYYGWINRTTSGASMITNRTDSLAPSIEQSTFRWRKIAAIYEAVTSLWHLAVDYTPLPSSLFSNTVFVATWCFAPVRDSLWSYLLSSISRIDGLSSSEQRFFIFSSLSLNEGKVGNFDFWYGGYGRLSKNYVTIIITILMMYRYNVENFTIFKVVCSWFITDI